MNNKEAKNNEDKPLTEEEKNQIYNEGFEDGLKYAMELLKK